MQEVALAMLPLLAIFLVFHLFLLRLPLEKIKQILTGMVLSLVGIAFFLQGVQVGFFPAGSAMGEQLGRLPYNWVVIPIGVMLGFVVVVAEPAVRVLNYEVEKVSGGFISQRVMLYTLSVGVAVSVGLAMARIVYGIPLIYLLLPGYIIAMIILKFSSPTFVAVAFDSGGVATGPMTVTFIMALAVGIATGIPGRDPLLDGFGLISLVALAPILSVLTLGLIYGGRSLDDEGQ